MKRTVLAATAAVLLAGVSFGIAAPNGPAGGPGRPAPEQMQQNAAAMTDARIAALKAGLKLTADQEKLWLPLEAALRDYGQQRFEWRQEMRERREAMRAERGARPGGPGPQADAGAPPPPPGAGAPPPPPPGGPAPQAGAGAPPPPPPGAGPEGPRGFGPERDVVARLGERANRLLAEGTSLKELADAAAPLYASLDDGQKHRFAVLFREARGDRQAEWRRDRHHGPQRGHGWERADRREFGRPPHGGPGMPPPDGPDAGPQRL
ncbi:hypothetical protein J2X65_001561 [Ancylobacter sp. 3268]|uniref:hypothetical protein n=1 Tax=Ancylobacter sp. 3268 TaxID=2817752 RepID=UPI002864CD54|nr:hypothetical protein [Ancylobacter sp. 3268]MDR6952210.1 hypothetical protein [Ancylobacter sp. 3268]